MYCCVHVHLVTRTCKHLDRRLHMWLQHITVYLGLFFGGCPAFLQQNRRWLSIWIDVSSVYVTSRNPVSASCTYCVAHSKRLALFGSRIIFWCLLYIPSQFSRLGMWNICLSVYNLWISISLSLSLSLSLFLTE